MVNERKTEDLVEKRLRRTRYYEPDSGIIVEKQHSDTERINKLLENASKSGRGAGKPEFIIRSAKYSDFIVIIECKASPQKHESASRTKYSDYAVDGVLLYASFLSKEFDVLAIAVSGEDEASFRISHILYLHGANKGVDWKGTHDIVPLDDYSQEFLRSDVKFRQDYDALLDYNRRLNNKLTGPTFCTKASERVYITTSSGKDANGGAQGAVGDRRAAICGASAAGAGGL